MDERVVQFIREVAQTIVGLDLALYLQAHPKTSDTAAGLALRLRRPVEQIEPSVKRLAESGILRQLTASDGSYHCYALDRSPEVWHLLCLISEAYLDNHETRKQIVKMLIRQHQALRTDQNTEPAPPSDS